MNVLLLLAFYILSADMIRAFIPHGSIFSEGYEDERGFHYGAKAIRHDEFSGDVVGGSTGGKRPEL